MTPQTVEETLKALDAIQFAELFSILDAVRKEHEHNAMWEYFLNEMAQIFHEKQRLRR